MSTPDHTDSRLSIGYELFLAALSGLALVNLVLSYVIEDAALDYVLQSMTVLLSIVFAGDFAYRLQAAPSRVAYLGRGLGWADLVSALPLMEVKVLRLPKLLRLRRDLRKQGLGGIATSLVRDRAGSALLMLMFTAILVLEIGSLQILRLESAASGSTITDASDALWYSIATMSTVGYGDTYPVTNAGRLLGSVMIVIGVCIFGTLTGFLANKFVARAEHSAGEPPDRDEQLHRRLDDLRVSMDAQEKALREINEIIGRRERTGE